MEEWYSLVRKLEDETENPKILNNATHEIFRTIASLKIKEKHKFEERMGSEFERFVESLKSPPEMVKYLLWNDEFFTLTMKLQQVYKR